MHAMIASEREKGEVNLGGKRKGVHFDLVTGHKLIPGEHAVAILIQH